MKHNPAGTQIRCAARDERKLSGLLLCCVALILARPAGGQQSSSPSEAENASRDQVAMTVDERQISVSELCRAIATLPPPQAKAFPVHPTLAAQWYGPLVALAEEAKREHLGETFQQGEISPVDQANALSAELIRKIARESEPTEREIELYYKSHPDEFERTRARHIVISYATALASRSGRSAPEAQIEAQRFAAQLKQGADFATLAARDSEDPYTQKKGGDLGEVAHNQMEPAVDHAIWSLAPGETSPPFAGRFGYEIVKVEGRRALPLDEARAAIVGNIKFLRTIDRRREIISAARIQLKRTYMDSELPCEVHAAALGK